MARRVVKKSKPVVKKPAVKKLVLKPTEVAEFVMPPGHFVNLISDHSSRRVGIAPMPEEKKRTLWQRLFGN